MTPNSARPTPASGQQCAASPQSSTRPAANEAATKKLPTPGPPRGLALDAAPFGGVVVLGMGDAVASVVGVHVGRCRWPGTRKTVEGTAAAAASMLLLLLLLRWLLQGGARADWAGSAADWGGAALWML